MANNLVFHEIFLDASDSTPKFDVILDILKVAVKKVESLFAVGTYVWANRNQKETVTLAKQ